MIVRCCRWALVFFLFSCSAPQAEQDFVDSVVVKINCAVDGSHLCCPY